MIGKLVKLRCWQFHVLFIIFCAIWLSYATELGMKLYWVYPRQRFSEGENNSQFARLNSTTKFDCFLVLFRIFIQRFMRWEFRAYSSKKLLHFLREKMSSLLLFIKFVLTATTNSWKWSVQCQTWRHFIISQQWDSSKVVLHYFPFEQLFVRDCGVVTRDASNHPRRKYFAETRHRVVKKGKDRKNVLSIVLFD